MKPDFEKLAREFLPDDLSLDAAIKETAKKFETLYEQGRTDERERKPTKYALQSKSGMHIGMWDELDRVVSQIQPEYPDSTIIHLLDVTPRNLGDSSE